MAQNGNDPKFLVAEKILIALNSHHMGGQANFAMDYGRDTNIEQIGANFEIEVRFWGDWTCSGEDYDHEEPLANTRQELDKICEKFSTNKIKVGWGWGEKYWLYIGIQ